jgi:hypothetical protein
MLATLSLCLAASLASLPASPGRPLSDFLGAQGTTSVFAAPLPDYIAWSDGAHGMMMSLDYAGLAEAWTMTESGGAVSYGTTITGSISEHPLADGRADVHITLHIHDALGYVVAFDAVSGPDFSDIRFGRLAPAALAAHDAALGDAEMEIRLINTAPGAPIPDLVDAFILGNAQAGQELRFIRINGQATGALRAASGFPEGASGRAAVVQTGVLQAGFHGAVGDGFPVERVTLRRAP